MLKYLLFICCLCLSNSLWAQDLAPEVLASTGGSATNSGISLSWTVGETLTNTASNPNSILTQGFHQSNLSLAALSEQAQGLQLEIFPNPAYQWLYLRSTTSNRWHWTLFTVHGRALQNGLLQQQAQIDLSAYPSGLYLLRVQDHQGAYNSYKITVRH